MASTDDRYTTRAFLKEAVRIAHQLNDQAIWLGDKCNWTGDNLVLIDNRWKVVHEPLDNTIYSGTAGVALFLSYLWKFTREDTFRNLAIGALRTMVGQTSLDRNNISIGLYSGLTGMAAAIILSATNLEMPELADDGWHMADRIFEGLDQKIGHNINLDILDGLAGLLLGIIFFADHNRCTECETQACKIANKIIESAYRSPAGWSWAMSTGNMDGNHLCGMAHGASGIAWALMEFHIRMREKRYRRAALEGFRYEKGWFNRFQSNWPDIRETDYFSESKGTTELVYPVYWCHGAAGIGLTRLRVYQLTGNLTMLAEAGAAIHAARTCGQASILTHSRSRTKIQNYDDNFSICHGLGSIIDLHIYAYQVLGIPEYLQFARKLGMFGIHLSESNAHFWKCGIPGGTETPSLMLGLAGIGMCLLRLHDPAAAPPTGIFPVTW